MQKRKRRDPRGNILNTGETYSKSNGYYRFSYTDPMGKRRQISATDLVRLRDKEDRLFFRMRSELNEYTGGNLTLNDMFDLYMGTKHNIKRQTRENYYYMYDRFVRPRFGVKKITEYRYSDLLTFYHMLAESGLKYNTLDNIQTVIYPTFEMARRDGVIKMNPAEGAKSEIKKTTGFYRTKIHPITKEEQERFLLFVKENETYSKWYPLFVFMFGTGVRIGELGAIMWDDIDFDKNLIRVERAIIRERNPSGAYEYVVTVPKTDSGIRTIPMLPEVREVLLMIRDHEGRGKGKRKGFLFKNRDGGIINQQSVNRAIRRIMEEYNSIESERAVRENRKAVLLPYFTSHMIRHSFCSRLCENETNIKVIQSVMGQTDIRTTMEIYAEVSDERKQFSFKNYSDAMGLV